MDNHPTPMDAVDVMMMTHFWLILAGAQGLRVMSPSAPARCRNGGEDPGRFRRGAAPRPRDAASALDGARPSVRSTGPSCVRRRAEGGECLQERARCCATCGDFGESKGGKLRIDGVDGRVYVKALVRAARLPKGGAGRGTAECAHACDRLAAVVRRLRPDHCCMVQKCPAASGEGSRKARTARGAEICIP